MVSVTIYFEKRRSLATGIALSGSGIGQFFWSPVMQGILDNYGLNKALTILSVVVLSAGISALVFKPIKSSELLDSDSTSKTKEDKIDWKAIRNLMVDPVFLLFTASNFLTCFSFSVPSIFIKVSYLFLLFMKIKIKIFNKDYFILRTIDYFNFDNLFFQEKITLLIKYLF